MNDEGVILPITSDFDNSLDEIRFYHLPLG